MKLRNITDGTELVKNTNLDVINDFALKKTKK